jgi:hypothetical protein
MPDLDKPFTDMAEVIQRQLGGRGADFAGAFVIVPPDGKPQTLLMLDNAQNEAIFWSTLKTRADIALSEIEEASRAGQFGGRR